MVRKYLEDLEWASDRQMEAFVEEYGASVVLSDMILSRSPAPEFMGQTVRLLVKTLERKIQETTHQVTSVPASWWDATKQRWFPFLGYKEREILTKVEVRLVCPHQKLAPQQDHLVFLSYSPEVYNRTTAS